MDTPNGSLAKELFYAAGLWAFIWMLSHILGIAVWGSPAEGYGILPSITLVALLVMATLMHYGVIGA